jgi:hypothetical protein
LRLRRAGSGEAGEQNKCDEAFRHDLIPDEAVRVVRRCLPTLYGRFI